MRSVVLEKAYLVGFLKSRVIGGVMVLDRNPTERGGGWIVIVWEL